MNHTDVINPARLAKLEAKSPQRTKLEGTQPIQAGAPPAQWIAELNGEPKFPALELVTRPNLKTEEAAFYLNRAPQTLRAWACLENGPLRPRRIGGLLAWSTSEVKALAGVAQ